MIAVVCECVWGCVCGATDRRVEIDKPIAIHSQADTEGTQRRDKETAHGQQAAGSGAI